MYFHTFLWSPSYSQTLLQLHRSPLSASKHVSYFVSGESVESLLGLLCSHLGWRHQPAARELLPSARPQSHFLHPLY